MLVYTDVLRRLPPEDCSGNTDDALGRLACRIRWLTAYKNESMLEMGAPGAPPPLAPPSGASWFFRAFRRAFFSCILVSFFAAVGEAVGLVSDAKPTFYARGHARELYEPPIPPIAARNALKPMALVTSAFGAFLIGSIIPYLIHLWSIKATHATTSTISEPKNTTRA